ncbi:hypothetical protein [Candidatus Desulfovibrio trichonymphae]|uniref:hypothetical protein n=1 Tax=Candidatus Desulfovibrio trichonymphae TaxID=1725232 RepID=UPI001556022A|nr:hypothetical protein [Candidatus Desulfovibrio trichonymphae]GHV00520.1 hypothetical protein AGMMS50248_10290 [Deltaproteobacteria bacterium]
MSIAATTSRFTLTRGLVLSCLLHELPATLWLALTSGIFVPACASDVLRVELTV